MSRTTEQEVKPCRFVGGYCTHCEATERGDCQGWVSSTNRQWVGLTDEDVRQCSQDVVAGGSENSVDRFAYAIEAKLKQKNNT